MRLNNRRGRNRNETLPPKIEKLYQGIREKYKLHFQTLLPHRWMIEKKPTAFRERETEPTDAIAVYQQNTSVSIAIINDSYLV